MENNKYPAYSVGQDNLAKSTPVNEQNLSPSFSSQEEINKNPAPPPPPQALGETVQNYQPAVVSPVVGTISNSDTPSSNVNYATLSSRAMANFIDGIIIGLIYLPFMLPNLISQLKNPAITNMSGAYGITGSVQQTTIPQVNPIYSLLSVVGYIITIAYPIYFIGKSGATPGKKALKIKVVDKETGKNPGYLKAFLREFVGKFISSVVLSLGYLWAVWDKEKQGWHDKIAGTVVIKNDSSTK